MEVYLSCNYYYFYEQLHYIGFWKSNAYIEYECGIFKVSLSNVVCHGSVSVQRIVRVFSREIVFRPELVLNQ